MAGETDQERRAARLAEALRVNLRRRKAQTRETAAPPVEAVATGTAGPPPATDRD